MNTPHSENPPPALTRRIWVCADPHTGHVSDGKDGGEWFREAVEDICGLEERVDFALCLGDMSYQSLEQELQTYRAVSRESCISRWYEIPGNHDMKSVFSGLYESVIGCPRYWRITDGNTVFISLPAERGNAAGLLVPEVQEWLEQTIGECRQMNIVICAHQFPYGTVEHSTRSERCLYPRDSVERLINTVPIDAWLGGHIHSGKRTPAAAVRKNSITYINVASVSHTYHTEICNSFLLEFTEGERTVRALCRDHDHGAFIPEQSLEIPLRFPAVLDRSTKSFEAFPLEVPERYRTIEPEQVTCDMFDEKI